MRSDVKNLLDKLGQSQFRYKEFADRFSDLETWPVFEAVIRDPRVFNYAAANAVQGTAASSAGASPAPIASVLSRKYGADEGVALADPSAATPNPSADVRALLARISSAVEKGAI